jgi:cytochrome c-type biogenesis protein
MDQVSFLAAFAAGLLSFISPCVLPLVPGYLSFVSGVSLDEMRGVSGGAGVAVGSPPEARRRVLVTSLAFVIGFSMVFVALGASASFLGQFLLARLSILGRIAGVIVVVFGLHMMGVFRIGWLYSEKRVHTSRKPAGLVGAGLVGVAFAFGWTPCIGPILAGILAIAATKATVLDGVRLLAVYSAGLAIPFLLTSLAVDRFFSAFARIRRHYRAIELTSGALLVVIGILIFTNRLTVIAQYLTPYLPVF